MNKKQILFSALFLTFACASAGAAPPEPSALGAFCPPSEGKSFHSGWISLGLKAADLKEKQASAGHITDVGEAQVSASLSRRMEAAGQTHGPVYLSGRGVFHPGH